MTLRAFWLSQSLPLLPHAQTVMALMTALSEEGPRDNQDLSSSCPGLPQVSAPLNSYAVSLGYYSIMATIRKGKTVNLGSI